MSASIWKWVTEQATNATMVLGVFAFAVGFLGLLSYVGHQIFCW